MKQQILLFGGLAAGGVQSHLSLLAKDLQAQGAAVTLFGTECVWPQELLDDLQARGVRLVVTSRKPSPMQKTLSVLQRTLMLRRFDCVYYIGYGRSHGLVQSLLPRRTFSIYHEIVDCPPLGHPMRQLVTRVSAIVANSRDVAGRMRDSWPQTNIKVIPFLTAETELPPPAPRRPVDGSLLRIAFLGRIVSHKRPDFLVRRWGEFALAPPIAPARLDVYGEDDPALLADLRREAAESPYRDSITLHGAYKTADLDRILANTDLVVLPAQFEGLPLVLVEAMMRGVPIVATNAGGTAELALDNPDATVTDRSWEAFLAGLRQFCARIRAGQTDPERLYQWTKARYGTTVVARQWEQALLQPGQFWHRSSL